MLPSGLLQYALHGASLTQKLHLVQNMVMQIVMSMRHVIRLFLGYMEPRKCAFSSSMSSLWNSIPQKFGYLQPCKPLKGLFSPGSGLGRVYVP